MIAIISLLLVILLSIIITRIASIALTHTGLSRESARFQARSAFTGVGFTTTESEMIVNHPLRRRVVLTLMLLGNAGLVTAVSSLILTFARQDGGAGISMPWKLGLLIAGVIGLWLMAESKWVDRHLSNLINRALKRFTELEVTDYASILHFSGDYRLGQLYIQPRGRFDGKDMQQSRLKEEGIIVLGIERKDGGYIGTPKGDTNIFAGDTLIIYGHSSDLKSIDQR